MTLKDEFYVGYLPKAPRGIAWRIGYGIGGLVVTCGLLAFILVDHQARFAAATFEYDRERSFSGTVQATTLPIINLNGGPAVVLVAPGKHGYVLPADLRRGTQVSFRGKLIQRDQNTMIEVSSPIQVNSLSDLPLLGTGIPMEMEGELIDTKCFTGVMNPGSGKVHRACAARCLHGGIAPAVVTKDGGVFYLSAEEGKPFSRELISSHAGEHIVVRGQFLLIDNVQTLSVRSLTFPEN